jgi:hypothetical protein
MTLKQQIRAKAAIERFKAQLKSGVKNTKQGPVPLSEKDIKRINQTIDNTKRNILSSKKVRVDLS